MTREGSRLPTKCLFSTPPWLARGRFCPYASVLRSCNYWTEKISQVDLGKRFQCSQSTISKNQDAILRETEANVMGSRKRKRSWKGDEVDAALHTWFVDARARDAPIPSAVLEEKANHLAVLLNKPQFRYMNRWLCRWKIRHGIKFKKAHGEKGCRC